MENKELLQTIKETVFSVYGESYKFVQPDSCFDEEWQEASAREKAFLIIEDLLINSNKEELKNKQTLNSKTGKILEIKLFSGPQFYSIADENMFFDALYSIPAVVDVKGNGKELFLYCTRSITCQEKDFLKGLLKRYRITIPIEITK